MFKILRLSHYGDINKRFIIVLNLRGFSPLKNNYNIKRKIM